MKEKQTSGDGAVTEGLLYVREKSAENSDPKLSGANNLHRVSSPHLSCTMVVYKFGITVFHAKPPCFL